MSSKNRHLDCFGVYRNKVSIYELSTFGTRAARLRMRVILESRTWVSCWKSSGESLNVTIRDRNELITPPSKQNIMLHLQEKAHYSLDEFRKGRGSPMSRYHSSSEPPTPVDEDDELSILGGKTRLVAKKEPSSPTIMDRSPTSLNPVVPLPLSPSMEGQMHPTIWEYLDTFVPHPQQQQQQGQGQIRRHQSSSSTGSAHQGSYGDEVSPVSMYGLSALPTSTTFQTEPTSYLQQQQQQQQGRQSHHTSPTSPTNHQLAHHHSLGNLHATTGNRQGGVVGGSQPSFPQYFPVYDYGTALNGGGMNGANGMTGINGGSVSGMGNGYSTYGAPMLESPMPPGQRKGSGSPEANMDTMWHDFVAGVAM